MEAVVQEQLAFRLARGEDGAGSLADGNQYRTADGGYDVGRRLADVRKASPELTDLHADPLRYDLARANLDRHAPHAVAAYLAGMSTD